MSTCCFTALSVSVSITPITKGPPAQFFFAWYVLFRRSLSFDFCYDLDIWAHGQALREFFVVSFFTILSKYEGDFDQTWQEAS